MQRDESNDSSGNSDSNESKIHRIQVCFDYLLTDVGMDDASPVPAPALAAPAAAMQAQVRAVVSPFGPTRAAPVPVSAPAPSTSIAGPSASPGQSFWSTTSNTRATHRCALYSRSTRQRGCKVACRATGRRGHSGPHPHYS